MVLMLKIKKISDVIGKHVYTSEGDYFGQLEEVNLIDNKIEGWRIKIGSSMIGNMGGARGVIIPHQFVKAIGDVVIVTRASLPVREESMAVPSEMSAGMDSLQ